MNEENKRIIFSFFLNKIKPKREKKKFVEI